ncbi:MAG: trimethylamine methyltransferase family protein [Sedimentisphaerales bacterium]|jgi:trimethylamine--corrinoid protein Co-methyltransferase|nr:trimethylamine methyltransferase family protein [Sedimentisphaerales bacterium]
MAKPGLRFLSDEDVQAIHEAALLILRDTGVKAHHAEARRLLADAGATVDEHSRIARLPERLVMESIARTGKRYVLHGRDPHRTARFGYGDRVWMSSPGQYTWIDSHTGRRRGATVQDVRDAIRLGDALDHIHIVGAMGQPEEISEIGSDIFLMGELAKGTTKPTRCWVRNGRTAGAILEIYRAVAGGAQALQQRPMAEAFLEPISPLQLPEHGLDIVKAFAQAGQPVSIGPMAMTSATAPGTLGGTLAQENAEILAGLVMTQLFAPGTPVLYGGIPHIMDPRTSICSFGSPEQGLMAVAMVQMARFYGLPVYVNVGLTDAKMLDAQAGIEKTSSMLLGLLAGADTFGHCGICGTDHGASLEWLYLDNELAAYVERIARGLTVDAETLAAEVIRRVGPGGNYLADEHTVRHFRNELWLSGPAWNRQSWDGWEAAGCISMNERAREQVQTILATHRTEPMEEKLAAEVDRIVQCAQRELD